MNFYLLPALELGPRVIRRLLDQLPERALDHAPNPDRFTPREVIAHLAEWEPIMRERIRDTVAQPGLTIVTYDEGQMAIDHGYAQTDPAEQMELFLRERAITIELVRSLQPEDWGKIASHPERGPQSAEDFANTLIGHDMYHAEQLSEHLIPKG